MPSYFDIDIRGGAGPSGEIYIKILLPPEKYCDVQRPLRASPGLILSKMI